MKVTTTDIYTQTSPSPIRYADNEFEEQPDVEDTHLTVPEDTIQKEVAWLLDRAIPIAQEFGSMKDMHEWQVREKALRNRIGLPERK